MREIKFRAWDGMRMTASGIMFNTSIGEIYTAGNMPLMQYTGLKDKNGVEIYEGDMVIYHDPGGWYGEKKDYTETVEFNDGKFEPFYSVDVAGDTYCKQEECEVIGNIYENP